MLKEKESKIRDNIHSAEKVELVHSGEDYFIRLHDIISKAKSEIHLQTYIFENDSTGIKVANALKEAASRNVKVYVLLDGYGSSALSRQFVNDLRSHGIFFRFFSPLFSTNNFYIGRRLHHKVIVVDEKTTLIGGINIADKYRGTATTESWLDYAVQIESGEIGGSLQRLCRTIYFKEKRTSRKTIKSIMHSVKEASILVIQNDWLKRKNEIGNSYIKAIRNAKEEIIIVGSYFLPGKRLMSAIKKASRKGIKIKIILSGISDIPFVRQATCYLYSSLLKSNIELYEWNNSVLHGKAAVVGGKWATVGSFNLNHLSSYGSIEMNVEINSAEFSKNFTLHLDTVIDQCENITHEIIETRNGFFTKTRNWLSYCIVRMALVIVTYIPHKRFTKLY